MEGNFSSSSTQGIWDSSAFGLGMDCLFNPSSIEHSVMDQSDPFESTLSSIVSSPVASSNVSTICNNGESDLMMHELVGRLGSISNHPDLYNKNSMSANTSSCNAPLNSPPKQQIRACASVPGIQFSPQLPSLDSFSTDPGFIERAARFSCFGSTSFSSLNGQFKNGSELRHPGKISRALEGPPLNVAYGSQSKGKEVSKSLPRTGNQENAETGASREGSSISDQIPAGELSIGGQNGANSRKRKPVPKGKPKDATADDKVAKKSKTDEDDGNVKDNGAVENAEPSEKDKQSGENANKKQNKDNSKPSEPPKDYIHVRARRGQATDSHSLAERVRREKISERMKFLQDLVPGCNKVTGKAAMLDEIINYVQSLQRQVEFLSMKLANVNPRINFEVEAILSKDLLQSIGSTPHSMLPNNSLMPSLPYEYQSQQELFLHNGIPNNNGQNQMSLNPLNAANANQRNQGIQLPSMNPFSQAPPQISSIWEEDLQNIVPIGSAAATQMKIEL